MPLVRFTKDFANDGPEGPVGSWSAGQTVHLHDSELAAVADCTEAVEAPATNEAGALAAPEAAPEAPAEAPEEPAQPPAPPAPPAQEPDLLEKPPRHRRSRK